MESRQEHNSLRGIISLLKNNIFDNHIDNFFNGCQGKCKHTYVCENNCATGVSLSRILAGYNQCK
jgi:hypothetical protein